VIEPKEARSIAQRAAAAAARLLEGASRAVGAVRSKSNPRDLVTEWDTRSEEVIRAVLDELAPGVPILGEEHGETGDPSVGARWLVDPIDGTVNFVHGLPLFAISIAYEQAETCSAGVVVAPALGWEFAAHLDGGAWLNGERISVSDTTRLEDAMLVTGFPYDRATSGHNFAEWEHFQRRAGACRRLGAASLDLAFVARGWLDGYWESLLHPWDVGAGALLVQEAGGRVTGITGEPFRAGAGHAVATNGRIHARVLEELEAVGEVWASVRGGRGD
jgi:myo-inositol-1(or 4)-monophosphatase